MVNVLGSAAGIGAVVGVLALALTSTGSGSGPAPVGSSAGSAGAVAYDLPLSGTPEVVQPFVLPAAAWAPGHRGVDLAGAVGQAVLAPASGTVAFAGTVVDRGVLTIDHPDSLRSSLEPVRWTVGAGAHVVRGQVVGTIEPVTGHCAPGTCVHWGVRRGEVYVDPLTVLPGVGPVVLLPDR